MTVITLTTDFGTIDGYVAAMKGVILEIDPAATPVDITHEIRPQAILEASFVLSMAINYFPSGTVHLAVVDPGVGTGRRGLAVSTPSGFFVGPDNGLFTFPLRECCPDYIRIENAHISLKPLVAAVSLTNPQYWRREVSNTFHGRDIFAPVAAHLSRGVPLSELGEAIDTITTLPGYTLPKLDNRGTLAHVIHIDHFGNIITDFRECDLPQPMDLSDIAIEIKGQLITRIVKTYAEAAGLAALFGSSGYLEIALANGRAAGILNAAVGDEVRVTLR